MKTFMQIHQLIFKKNSFTLPARAYPIKLDGQHKAGRIYLQTKQHAKKNWTLEENGCLKDNIVKSIPIKFCSGIFPSIGQFL